MKTAEDISKLPFESAERFDYWLCRNHDKSRGIWLMIAKKGSDISSITYLEAVETALAYGWIDSQKVAYDKKYFLQKFTPRGPKSVWSKTNRDKAIALIKAGKMRPSGLRQVKLAKANGEWDKAYEPQSRMAVPADFQRELDNNSEAQDFFLTLDRVNRYAILHRIQSARRPATRKKRIETFIEMLSSKQKVYSWQAVVR